MSHTEGETSASIFLCTVRTLRYLYFSVLFSLENSPNHPGEVSEKIYILRRDSKVSWWVCLK